MTEHKSGPIPVWMIYECVILLAIFSCIALAAKPSPSFPSPTIIDDSTSSLYKLFESLEKWINTKLEAKFQELSEESTLKLQKLHQKVLNEQTKQQATFRKMLTDGRAEAARRLTSFQQTMHGSTRQQISRLMNIINGDKKLIATKLNVIQKNMSSRTKYQLGVLQQALNSSRGDILNRMEKLRVTMIASKLTFAHNLDQLHKIVNDQAKQHYNQVNALEQSLRTSQRDTAKRLKKLEESFVKNWPQPQPDSPRDHSDQGDIDKFFEAL